MINVHQLLLFISINFIGVLRHWWGYNLQGSLNSCYMLWTIRFVLCNGFITQSSQHSCKVWSCYSWEHWGQERASHSSRVLRVSEFRPGLPAFKAYVLGLPSNHSAPCQLKCMNPLASGGPHSQVDIPYAHRTTPPREPSPRKCWWRLRFLFGA